jgi:hypothetical protein
MKYLILILIVSTNALATTCHDETRCGNDKDGNYACKTEQVCVEDPIPSNNVICQWQYGKMVCPKPIGQ